MEGCSSQTATDASEKQPTNPDVTSSHSLTESTAYVSDSCVTEVSDAQQLVKDKEDVPLVEKLPPEKHSAGLISQTSSTVSSLLVNEAGTAKSGQEKEMLGVAQNDSNVKTGEEPDTKSDTDTDSPDTVPHSQSTNVFAHNESAEGDLVTVVEHMAGDTSASMEDDPIQSQTEQPSEMVSIVEKDSAHISEAENGKENAQEKDGEVERNSSQGAQMPISTLPPGSGTSRPPAPDSDALSISLTEESEGNKSDNQSDYDYDIISLNDEDLTNTTQFVITNVCSIREDDTYFHEYVADREDGDENSNQLDLESSSKSSSFISDSTSEHTVEGGDHAATVSENQATVSSAGEIPQTNADVVAHGQISVASEPPATGTVTSTGQPYNATPTIRHQSLPDTVPTVVSPIQYAVSSAAAAVPTVSSSLSSTATAELAVSVTREEGAGRNQGTDENRSADGYQPPHEKNVPAAVGKGKDSKQKSSDPFTIKFEPPDSGYETGAAAAASTSFRQTATGSSGGAVTAQGMQRSETVRPASESSGSRKRPHSGPEAGQEDQSNHSDQRKRQGLGSDDSEQNTLLPNRRRLDAVLGLNSNPGQANTALVTSGTERSEPVPMQADAGQKTFITLSKPLLVPSSWTKKSSSQPHNIPTKSVCLNLPPELFKKQSPTNEVSNTSAPAATGPSSRLMIGLSQLVTSSYATVPSSTLAASPAAPSLQSVRRPATVTSVATSSQQLTNDQLISHLRHVQDKPGSHQMLTIPMPDGSMHNIKVVYAPSLQPRTPVVSTTSSPTTLSQSVQQSTTDETACTTHAATGSQQGVTIIQVQGGRHVPTTTTSGISPAMAIPSQPSALRLQTSVRPATSFVSSVPLQVNTGVRPTLSFALSHRNPTPATSNTPPATVKLASFQPGLPQTRVVRPGTVPVGVRPMQSMLKTAPTSSSTSGSSAPVVSATLSQSQMSKRDLRFDQVSAEAKLSASDMAALIQGKNLVPFLEPRRRPGSKSNCYRCVECGIICCTLVGYTVHVKRMSMVIRYACMSCKAALVFFNKCTFLAHLRKHSTADSNLGQVLNLKSYTMSVSSLPDKLLPPIHPQHMDPLVINRNQPISCKECRQVLSDSSKLAVHFGSEIIQCVFAHTCTHCKMELPTLCALKAHLRLHDEKSHTFWAHPDFVCPECGLCFPNQASLYQHLFATCMHFNRCVNLRCPVCNLFQPTLQVLEDHLGTFHANQRRYQCFLCKRAYHSLQSFQHHFPQLHHHLKHTSFERDKLYTLTQSCSLCKNVDNEGAPSLQDKDHARKHMEEEKARAKFGFACVFCQETTIFTHSSELISHLSCKHEAYRFPCSMCQQGFVTLALLRIHVLSEHGSSKTTHRRKTCLKCTAGGQLSDESILPHVMWHILKMMTETADSQESVSTNPLSQRSMQIHVPKVNAMSNDEQKQMLICRSCGHVSPSQYALQRHIRKAQHVFCRFFSICPFCQRFDFVNDTSFYLHKKQCMTDSGVYSFLVVGEEEDERKKEREQEKTAKRARENDEQDNMSVERSKTVQPVTTVHAARLRTWLGAAVRKVEHTDTSADHQKLQSPSLSLKRPREPVKNQQPAKLMKIVRVFPKPCGKDSTTTHIAVRSAQTATPQLVAADRSAESQEPEFYPCHLCGLTYKSGATLTEHLARAHGGERNVLCCKLCRKKGKEIMLSKTNLKKHLVRKHNVAKPAAEGMVNAECENPQESTEDLATPGSSRLSTDSESSVSSASDRSPVRRLRITGDDAQEYVCAKCSFSSLSADDFRNHITTHAVENCVQCLECGLSFSAISSLKKHLFMVHKVKQPAAYVEKHDIKLDELSMDVASHMDSLAPLGEPEVVIKTAEMYHENLHAAKPFIEEIKEKRSRRSEDGEESVLECNVCYKEFENEGSLKSHMRTHGMAFIRSRRVDTRQSVSKNVPETSDDAEGAESENAQEITNTGSEDAQEITNTGSEDAQEITITGSEDAQEITNTGSEDAQELTNTGSEDAQEITITGSEDAQEITITGSEDAQELTITGSEDAQEITITGSEDAQEITITGSEDAQEITNTGSEYAQELTNTGSEDETVLTI
ncbi:zinc finger protein 532-like isoform X2 [Littorina saxatilis]|uniref:C2H2-type domain-containing protein n=2 Tax=Littorina saxatilis TaxID=31220 RepID=A0AAN9C3C2_9CAEN